MRALGPGSVSSFLTVILNVVYIALWIFAGLMLVAAIAMPVIATQSPIWREVTERFGASPERGVTIPVLIMGILGFAAYAGGIIVIVGRLRSIFKALTAGDPFHPDNVRRLRIIGLALGGLEAGRYAGQGLFRQFVEHTNMGWMSLSLTAWFSVLVVFVLAEVFREGARLRQEAELTI